MITLADYLKEKHVRFIDNSKSESIFGERNRAFISFALDDALATTVGDKSTPPTIRIWVHEPTLVMGIPDSRLPFIQDGIHWMKSHFHQVVIRSSGGLAVLLDRGVLNMSLIIPNEGELSIHDGYDMMYHFIGQLFEDDSTNIQAYEIKGSYCPGDYDLSIDGIKFAGISQRRVRQGVAVQIYLDISGSSFERASLVKEFYQISKRDTPTKYEYPTIRPEVMGTISDLVGQPYSVDQVIAKIKSLLQQSFTLTDSDLTSQEKILFQQRLLQMKKRNEKLTLG